MAKDTQGKGFTLLELVIFIVVAGIFIPMAYIAFMAASRASLNPEAVVAARFLAERKLEDITKDTYLGLQGEQASYVAIPGYTGYQWRWTIQNIAYQGRATHGTPTLAVPETWQANIVYRVGDYIAPATALPSIHFYRCVPRDRWRANTSYPMNSYVSPTVPNNLSYRATSRLLSSFSVWQANRPYALGDYVVPTAPNGHSYRCTGAGTSGAVEPNPWPFAGLQVDGSVTWFEDTNTLTTGNTEPAWPTASSSTVNDGSVTWVTEVMRSAATEPAWPTTGSSTVNDGSLRWQESTSYKHVTVYVREPKGHEYIANTIVTARPGAYP
jgi:type II secretory pathway pseudopilin PulG